MARCRWQNGILTLLASIAMSGCLPEAQESRVRAPAEEIPNRAPSISGTPSETATAGVSWQFQPDAADADGDELIFSATGLPRWAQVDTDSGMVYGTPGEGDVGISPTMTISVSDGEHSVSLPAFAVTVVTASPPPPPPPPPAVNSRPTISGTPAASVVATSAYEFLPTASDAETALPSLRFSILNKPVWAAFNTLTGRLSGTPASSQAGTYQNIVISVSDGTLSAALPPFSITVTPAENRPPTISGTPAAAVTAGVAYSFRPSAADPDGEPLTFAIANKPAWANFSTSSGRLSGTPGTTHVGITEGIVITVRDSTGATASTPAFSIRVNPQANRAPAIAGAPPATASVGVLYRFRPTASDADGDTLTWSIAGKPAEATFSPATGELSWTPVATGTWADIVITVADSAGSSASLPAFSITVTAAPVTGTAALSWVAPSLYTDGTALPASALDSYRIYQGVSATSLAPVAEVDAGTSAFTVRNLGAGTHYFAVTAISASGVESGLSAIGSKTIQ